MKFEYICPRNRISMKKILFFLAAVAITTSVFAQTNTEAPENAPKGSHKKKNANKKPALYIGLSGGINNPAGLAGIDFNLCLNRYLTLDAGTGVSTWGNKLYIGGKTYLKANQRGFAFGGGLSFNSGVEHRGMRIMTGNGRQMATFSTNPQANIFLNMAHYWRLGHRNNRFFTELGWSVPITHPKVRELYGPPASPDNFRHIERLAPGGLTFGIGFSFALYRK